MHGIKRSRIAPTPDSEQLQRKQREREAVKVVEYRTLLDQVFHASATKEHTGASLDLTTRILQLNPEFSTGWSFRRRILSLAILPTSSIDEQQQLLERDLKLTNKSLLQNPKNYSVWEHRKWVLQEMPEADWQGELNLVDAYLEKDGRNFHSWDYRRYLIQSIHSATPPAPVVDSIQSSETSTSTKKPLIISLAPLSIKKYTLPTPTTTSELQFTAKKISANFSNFSAWHYRTKLLPKLAEENDWVIGGAEWVAKIEIEFDLVKQAFWSDPNDQSAWLYHRWLVGDGSIDLVKREIQGVEGLLEEEPDSRWCLDSLVYYKKLLKSLLASAPTSDAESTRTEVDQLDMDCLRMLKRLEEIDAMRKARYQDLALTIVPHRR